MEALQRLLIMLIKLLLQQFCFQPIRIMKKLSLVLFCISVSTIYSCSKKIIPGKNAGVNSGETFIENNFVRLTFYPRSGTFDLYDKAKQLLVFKDAAFKFDNYVSSDPHIRFTSSASKDQNSLKIAGEFADGLTISLTADMEENGGTIVFTPSITNHSPQPVVIKNIYALSGAAIYPYEKLSVIQLLDGNGGGEITHVRNEPYCLSRNNLLFTGLVGKQRVSLTIGGLSYEYFEKFAAIRSSFTREQFLTSKMAQHQLHLMTYLDLGTDEKPSREAIKLSLKQGKPYTLQTTSIPELNRVVYDAKEVVISAQGLNPLKGYSLGFSWIDEYDRRVENVLVADEENPGIRFPLFSNKMLPTALDQDTAEQNVCNIPPEAYRSGKMKIYFQNASKAPNAVASEVWINEGKIKEACLVEKVSPGEGKQLKANLYSKDPIGKRLLPGESFRSEKDKFYIDCIEADPFVSLEKYALAVKKEQGIHLRPYTFPTVCLWYASHGGYGGEAAAVNDSRGAVEEMKKIAQSGFLKYASASVRLVPDSYLPMNEQGWWDDLHWQKYGSGGGKENVQYNVKVEGGHYKPPYETTAKWAQEVTRQGGIPLLYFQTGVRSQDYAEAFPQHMLFNQANHAVRNYWPNPDKSTYDFTDTAFIRHMQNVYASLRASGVQGLMFDYPITGWADYGGFEDGSKTTAWAYRNIFKLAHDGLGGDSSLVHERNLERGSDITLGTVASQRVWGDTDGMTPEMMSRCGLRWYKNRVVVSYDTDSKNLAKFSKMGRDKLRQVLTMVYVTTGRFLMGNSFSLLSKEDIYDLSRVFPFHTALKSARPVDAFVNFFPSVYDFQVADNWHLVTLYNQDDSNDKTFHVSLDASNIKGGLNLNVRKKYYFYDFWNQLFIGKLPGNEVLNQTLRKSEARMIAVHEVEDHPQFLSTNRHIMQGYQDLENIQWKGSANLFSGVASVIAGEPFKILIADNGYVALKAWSDDPQIRVNLVKNNATGIEELEIFSSVSGKVNWQLRFKK